MQLLVEIPWAQRVWALPFFTVLAPSAHFYADTPRSPKKLTDWARQMAKQVRRWLPEREIILVADSSYAALALLNSLQTLTPPVHMITPLRLDAALYEPPPSQKSRTVGRPRKRGQRLPTLQAVLDSSRTIWQMAFVDDWYGQGPTTVEITTGTALWYHPGIPPVPIRWVLVRDPAGKFKSRALLCTDSTVGQLQILRWFVRRWQVEVTFQEVRTHLGVETQRQWSAPAIARTTPLLLGLFSWVTLLAHQSQYHGQLPVRQAAWYHKRTPTFSDALAVVRRRIWEHWGLSMSGASPDIQKIPPVLLQRLFEALCYST